LPIPRSGGRDSRVTLRETNIWRVLKMIAQAYKDKERVTFLVLPAYERKAMRDWVLS